MSEYFSKLFDTSDFPARWHCGNWSDFLGWLHILSDLATFSAYFAIPAVLFYFARKRNDFPFTSLVWLFGAFILACGTVHLVDAIIFWYPIYRIGGMMKFVMAIISWVTIITLIRYIPSIMHLPSMAATNDRLKLEIIQREQTEQRLKESEASALAASKAKSAFLANMSHEIRTPMAAMLGYADVLLDHLKDPDNRNCVLVIKQNGQHLLELINDILDLSRIEAGKLDVEIEPISLVQFVSNLHSQMCVRSQEKGLSFDVKFASEIPDRIRTDSTRLRQVLINLIGNAIKFTEKGRVQLAVYMSQTNELAFSVRDTGIGISQEQQKRLFKPFSQGDSSVTRTYGGSGLGLDISNRLTRMLGGSISIESKLGVGSTFTVTIPILSTDDSSLVKPPSFGKLDLAVNETHKIQHLACRILVVDDRRDIRHISQHFLEKAGAKVTTAENGRQGIDVAIAARDKCEPFDLVVMDIQMPIVDGMEAVAALRLEGIDWPIIALTADAMKGDRDKYLNGGCDDYLSKPIDQGKLVSIAVKYTRDISKKELNRLRTERAKKFQTTLRSETSEARQ